MEETSVESGDDSVILPIVSPNQSSPFLRIRTGIIKLNPKLIQKVFLRFQLGRLIAFIHR